MGRGQELLDAAREGEKRTVEKILGQITKRSGPFPSLRRTAGVNVQDDNGYTPLHHACLNGHKDIIRQLLAADASPHILDKKGVTPLHLAAFNGDAEVVRMLLTHSNPPNIDQLTSDHQSALLIAAQFGFENIVAQLVAKGADVTVKNINGESAFDLAAQYGRLATVQHLLRFRPHLLDEYRLPASRGKIFESTPLHRASRTGRKDVVKVLIDAGIDPNIRTKEGTPLHEATRFGQDSIVRVLLKRGADIKVQDSNRKTVYELLTEYPENATRKIKKALAEYAHVITPVSAEYENYVVHYDSDEDSPCPPFPVEDCTNMLRMKSTETPKHTNQNDSITTPSSSYVSKYNTPSFVKKLASKCLGLKAKFNSAPNISNSLTAEVDVKSKQIDSKNNTSTLLIGNSKFFKMLSKKEESGDIVCNDEFDTISLDRLGTLNRDSVVNRSNRSCPGFKTSLPNISENNELSDSQESISESVVITEIESDKNNKVINLTEAVNYDANFNIFEPRTQETVDRKSIKSNTSIQSTNLVNECYESYEFSKHIIENNSIPTPPLRSTLMKVINNNDNIYENVIMEIKTIPKPAMRTHIPTKPPEEVRNNTLYENVKTMQEQMIPEPLKRTFVLPKSNFENIDPSSFDSRSSTLSSDSMLDESNLEDILLSKKSKSFRHRKFSADVSTNCKSEVCRTQSNASDSSNITDLSAIENVDCSQDVDDNALYLSMTGTMPNKKHFDIKKVLFRHKTFTNIEVDRNSIRVKNLPQWNTPCLKETLLNYHIRGTGHCIYNAPTIEEFIYIFNRDTLHSDVPPFTKVPSAKRDSYYETAICFCRPKPSKCHTSAEDLLDQLTQEEGSKATIDIEALRNKTEMTSSSFQCYCDSGSCIFHSVRRKTPIDLVVKFSVLKKSISTPDITLNPSPSLIKKNSLPKNKSVPKNLEDPYAIVTLEDIIARKSNDYEKTPDSPVYTSMSQPSTLSSSASTGLYSLKDISEVVSLNNSSTSTATLSRASDVPLPIRKSSSSEHSGHWSLQSCNSNITIKSDASFKTCLEESSNDSDGTLHSDEEISDAETIKSDVSTAKRPWVHSNSFRFGNKTKSEINVIAEETQSEDKYDTLSSKFESGISLEGSESSSSECEDDSGVPRTVTDTSLECASLERGGGLGGVRSGSARRRWDEADGTSEGDALSVSSAASSCAPLHLHHHGYSKVSPTPPKKPPRRNLSVSPTHANSPSSGYSYELRPHARSQDDLDDIQGAKHYLKHGRSVDQYVDGKLSYSEYEENSRVIPIPNPRPSLKQRPQPVAITAVYENIAIKEQNPRRKLKRNNFVPADNYDQKMNDSRVRKYSNQENTSLESLLDDQSLNSPSDCERYYEGKRALVPLSPTHYEQPPTPDHPPPSARQAENCIHERIRPLSQLIMEVVEEIRIRKMSQSDISTS